jgi:mannobiose 2-epimerase
MTEAVIKKCELWRDELRQHAHKELLPFWLDRAEDSRHGGFITHFDAQGRDSGEDQKSMIAQTRSVFSFSMASRYGAEPKRSLSMAEQGVRFLLDKMWDREDEGFLWTVKRDGTPEISRKILYGHSFAIYGLCEYHRASGDREALSYAERVFDLIQVHASDLSRGGYFEMFEPDWSLSGPGAAGGDRKTLDAHMHLMEAYTNLARCTGSDTHRRRLGEVIDLLVHRMFRPQTGTGIPQFTPEWEPTAQIKFDIVWGWDRFSEDGEKSNPLDNTSYGHNVEFAWLLMEAMEAAGREVHEQDELIRRSYDHALEHGIDWEHGGVFVEGSHTGPTTDREKEFWQQAELMNGLLAAYLHWGEKRYLEAYEVVHRFVMDKMINHEVGEWWPLMSREGKPIWTHMSHSWKVNYHTIRAALRCLDWLEVITGNKATASLLK